MAVLAPTLPAGFTIHVSTDRDTWECIQGLGGGDLDFTVAGGTEGAVIGVTNSL